MVSSIASLSLGSVHGLRLFGFDSELLKSWRDLRKFSHCGSVMVALKNSCVPGKKFMAREVSVFPTG